jgi:hypothetical protein
MDILKSIFQGNEAEIKDYYSANVPSETEFLLAFSCYGISKNEISLNTLKIVTEEYSKTNSDDFKENFAHHFKRYGCVNHDFFSKMKDTESFTSFLQEYGSFVQERINLMSEKIQSENLTEHNSMTLGDFQEMSKIILDAKPTESKKEIPLFPPSYRLPLDWRIFELNKPIDKKYEIALEQELILSAYMECKSSKLPITEVDAVISKTREIRNNFIKHSENSSESFSPLLYCLHKDIVKVVANKDNLNKDLHYNNLWENIPKYNINNISESDFEVVDLPKDLKEASKETKVRQAIWVLKKDGEAVFGGRHILIIDKNDVHHIDLANGENVVSAGTILFTEDMKKIIAINASSGHYRPTVESCLHMKKAMDKSQFDTSNTVICDLNWNPNISIIKHEFNVPSSDKIASNVLSIRDKSLVSNSSVTLKI